MLLASFDTIKMNKVHMGPLRLAKTPLLEKEGIALFNSASLWASTQNDLRLLYESRHTALVTIRTALVTEEDVTRAAFTSSFEESKFVHNHAFLRDVLPTHEGGRLNIARGSLNSYGYSPIPLQQYQQWIEALWLSGNGQSDRKPFIISITGSDKAVEGAITLLRQWTGKTTNETSGLSAFVAVEINLSCPNIKGNAAPSGYDSSAVKEYVLAAQRANRERVHDLPRLAVSLKLPPYTYHAQFDSIFQALASVPVDEQEAHPIAFLTSTNTLGGAFWLNEGNTPGDFVKALPTANANDTDGISFDGTGGMAGESLHPIALGNVYKLRALLSASSDPRIRDIGVIGVGGVISGLSAQRMKAAGADAVSLATALGREGVSVFERISNEILHLSGAASDEDGEDDVHFSMDSDQ